MVSGEYTKATGFGVVITFLIWIFCIYLNIVLNPAFLLTPLNNWIFIGPLLFLSQSGFFIWVRFASPKGFTDEDDKKRIRERFLLSISFFAGFVIWLFVLGIFTMIHFIADTYLSTFCGFAVMYGLYYFLKHHGRIKK